MPAVRIRRRTRSQALVALVGTALLVATDCTSASRSSGVALHATAPATRQVPAAVKKAATVGTVTKTTVKATKTTRGSTASSAGALAAPATLGSPLCPTAANRRAARVIFENRFAGLSIAASDPRRFDEVAEFLAPFVEAAADCADVVLLDRLASLFALAPPSLEKDADGRGIWTQNGTEMRLVSAEFLMLAGRITEATLALPAWKRTPTMVSFADQFLPVLAVHVDRWIRTARFDGWAGCTRPRVAIGHRDYVALLRSRSMGSELSYCNAVDDVDLLIMGIGAQLLRSMEDDPTVADATRLGIDRNVLTAYVRESADLVRSRLSATSLRGGTITGYDFDRGVFRDLNDDSLWAGYTGDAFPLSPTALIAPQKKDDRAGWDLGHARRLVTVLAAFRRTRASTGSTFPSDAEMTGFANQIAYGTMVGTVEWPAFSNYLSGLNGWYRVIYHGRVGFGYGPSDVGNSAFLEGGYGFWGAWSPELAALTSRMSAILGSSDKAAVEFRSTKIGLLWDNFVHAGGVSIDPNMSWTMIRFWSSAIVTQNARRPLDSDFDNDGAPDYLEIQAGTDPLVATPDAARTALLAWRINRTGSTTSVASSGAITAESDTDGDGVTDLDEVRCGTSPLDRADSRPGCPEWPAESR